MNNSFYTFLFVIVSYLCVSIPALSAAEITILPIYPEHDEFIKAEDLLVVFSIYDAEQTGSQKTISVFWDDEDITAKSVISERYVKFIADEHFQERPDVFGKHTVKVQILGADNILITEDKVTFNVATGGAKYRAQLKKRRLQFRDEGRYAANFRYDSYNSSGKLALDNNFTYRAYKGKWFFNTNMYVTTNEANNAQPRSRFKFTTGYGKKYKINIGDNYPSYHRLILAGKRIRGVDMSFKTYNRGVNTLNLQVAYGLSRMGNKNLGFTSKGIQETGVFKRRMLAIYPNFGSGEVFKLGFMILKSKDDIGSITMLRNANNSVIGATPKDNLVLGSNILIAVWKRRIILFGDYAFGVLTDDISKGLITQQQFDNLGVDIDAIDFLKKHQNKIMVNTSTSVLDKSIPAFLNASAYNHGLKFNYSSLQFSTYSEVAYMFTGPKYKSFGQENLGISKKGIKLTERLKLFNRKLILSGNLGFFENNLDNLETNTTNMNEYSFSAFLNPAAHLPRLNVRYSRNSNDTNIDSLATRSLQSVIFATAYSKDLGITTNHLNISISNVLNNFVSTTKALTVNILGFNVTTNYKDLPFRTHINASTNLSNDNTAPGYYSFSSGILYQMASNLTMQLAGNAAIYSDSDNKFGTTLRMNHKLNKNMQLDLYGTLGFLKSTTDSYLDLRYAYNF